MIKNDIESSTGYGIGTEKHGDVFRLIEIDTDLQHVVLKTMPHNDEPKIEAYSFDQYVNLHNPEWP